MLDVARTTPFYRLTDWLSYFLASPASLLRGKGRCGRGAGYCLGHEVFDGAERILGTLLRRLRLLGLGHLVRGRVRVRARVRVRVGLGFGG